MPGSGAADGVGVTVVGRDATSIGAAGAPGYVDVPPGRYWPAGASMRTVEAVTDGVVVAKEFVGVTVGVMGGAIGVTLEGVAATGTGLAPMP